MLSQNLKIVTDNGILYYSDTSIKLNRITDDLADITKKFADYSYTLTLPKSKNNRTIFEYPDVKGRKNIFKGKKFPVKVYSNNEILVDGQIELLGFNDLAFSTQITSKFTELVDSLKDKKLVDLKFTPVVYNFEQDIIFHINGSKISPHIEFPLTFYNTYFISGATNDDFVTTIAGGLNPELKFGVLRNNDLSSHPSYKGINPLYAPQLPPAVYLKSIFNQIIQDAGWTMNSSFFDRSDISKIILLYTSGSDQLTAAVTTGTTNYLNINKLLPDMDQSDFLKQVIILFNLYYFVNPSNKTITIEPYTTLFTKYNGYDITGKVDKSTIVISQPDKEQAILFTAEDGKNSYPFGYNKSPDYMTLLTDKNPSYTINPNRAVRAYAGGIPQIGRFYSQNAFTNLWNKNTGDSDSTVELKFTPCNYYPLSIINSTDIFGLTTNTSSYINHFTVSIPLVTEQKNNDDKGHNYNDDPTDNYVAGNAPARFDLSGGLKLAYYYGDPKYDYKFSTNLGLEAYWKWLYINIADAGTATAPTYSPVLVQVASPYKLLSLPEFNQLKTFAVNNYSTSGFSNTLGQSELGAEAHNLLGLYYSCGTTGNTHSSTSFSLTMGDNDDFLHPNIYSTFHKDKYLLLRNSSLFKATMSFDSNDWREMQIYRNIIYDGEFYQIVSIKSFDVIKQTAEINLLKK